MFVHFCPALVTFTSPYWLEFCVDLDRMGQHCPLPAGGSKRLYSIFECECAFSQKAILDVSLGREQPKSRGNWNAWFGSLVMAIQTGKILQPRM